MTDEVQAVGKILTAFLKSGPKSASHVEEIHEEIAKIVAPIVMTSEKATEDYTITCRDFLENVEEVEGLPARAISGGGGSRSNIVSASGAHVSKAFPALMPSILERFEWCIKNYDVQSKLYLDDQLAQFRALVSQFLEEIPVGGSNDKAIRSRVSQIKSEIRSLSKWNQLFYTYKAMSFPAEIDYIFALAGNPIAAVWHYSSLDEQGEYPKTYSHKGRDAHVYAVRGNWAIDKGLMRAGPDGYLDEISRPHQEIGCMCRLQWVSGITRLPSGMLTEKGRSEVARVRKAANQLSEKPMEYDTKTRNYVQKSNIPAEFQATQGWLRGKLLRWFGRG